MPAPEAPKVDALAQRHKVLAMIQSGMVKASPEQLAKLKDQIKELEQNGIHSH